MKKILIAVAIVVFAILLYRFGLTDNPVLVIGAFFLIYVISPALSLQGAAILTLAGGALFGLVTGSIIVSFASTIGEYMLAMRRGLGLNKILGTVHAYPTMIEADKFAAGKWKKANAPEWAFPWLAKFHSWQRG